MKKYFLGALLLVVLVAVGIVLSRNSHPAIEAPSMLELSQAIYPYESDLATSPEALVAELSLVETIPVNGGSLLFVGSESLSGSSNISGLILLNTGARELKVIAPFTVSLGSQNNRYLVSPDNAYVAIETLTTVSTNCAYPSITISRLDSITSPFENVVMIGELSLRESIDPDKEVYNAVEGANWTASNLQFKQSLVKCTTGNTLIGPLPWQYSPDTGQYSREQ